MWPLHYGTRMPTRDQACLTANTPIIPCERHLSSLVLLLHYRLGSSITLAICRTIRPTCGNQALSRSHIHSVITNIATPAEQGAFLSTYPLSKLSWASVSSFEILKNSSVTTAPSSGSLLGVLAYRTGRRWMFWLLSILSRFVLILLVSSLPETAPSVTGNRSIPLPRLLKPLFPETRQRSTECYWPTECYWVSLRILRRLQDRRRSLTYIGTCLNTKYGHELKRHGCSKML